MHGGRRSQCEPVSGPNSLLTGKNTGKFARLGPWRQSLLARRAHTRSTSDRLPLQSEQGIRRGRTGKIGSRSAKPVNPPSLSLLRPRLGVEWTLLFSGDVAFRPTRDMKTASTKTIPHLHKWRPGGGARVSTNEIGNVAYRREADTGDVRFSRRSGHKRRLPDVA
jgi:hypothetical protein